MWWLINILKLYKSTITFNNFSFAEATIRLEIYYCNCYWYRYHWLLLTCDIDVNKNIFSIAWSCRMGDLSQASRSTFAIYTQVVYNIKARIVPSRVPQRIKTFLFRRNMALTVQCHLGGIRVITPSPRWYLKQYISFVCYSKCLFCIFFLFKHFCVAFYMLFSRGTCVDVGKLHIC